MSFRLLEIGKNLRVHKNLRVLPPFFVFCYNCGMTNLHGIENEKILSQAENKIELEFVIPESSDFFDGHFPEFKLLPAVAQFEIITRFSRKYFGTQRYIPNIKRIKFSAPIRPDSRIHLSLEHKVEKGSVGFVMADADTPERVYSSGNFSVIPE